MSLSEKLCRIADQVGYIQKDSRNDFHGYGYASAERVLGKVRSVCVQEGVCISGTETQVTHITPDLSKAIVHVTLSLRDAETGEEASFQGTGEGSDKGDKAVMKAQTAAMKYAVASAFLISWGDDPEADPSTDRDASLLEVAQKRLEGCSSIEEINVVSKWVGSQKPNATLRPALERMFSARREAIGVNGNAKSQA